MKSTCSSCLFLLSLSTTANLCNGLATLSRKERIARNIPSVFTEPIAELKRTALKKRLIQATESKNEELITSLVDELSELNPTPVPTNGLLGYNDGDGSSAPLNGGWRLLYTNAQDAEAPARTEKNSKEKFGDEVATGVQVKTGQRIDAEMGECTNFIQLTGEKTPFDKLEITIKMTPLTERRVRLDFQKRRAFNENAPLPFLKDFRFNFPPPVVGDLLARARGLDPSIEPPAYFDILYIDQQLRAHRTGEGKIFIQLRD